MPSICVCEGCPTIHHCDSTPDSCGLCKVVPAPHKTAEQVSKSVHDMVNHPAHYTSHPSGVECIEITKHMDFCSGNAIKYIWRHGLKGAEIGETAVRDLKKALWYIQCRIEMLEGKNEGN